MLEDTAQNQTHCRFFSTDLPTMKPVIENFIQSFGGVSYDSGDLLVAKFPNHRSADECTAELAYLYGTLPLETEGSWMAVYLGA